MIRARNILWTVAVCCALQACYVMRPSSGGGQYVVRSTSARQVRPGDIALPTGYRIEVVATGLTYPSGVAFDDTGKAYVTESGYSYGEDWATPRLLRVDTQAQLTEVAHGSNGPWNGVASTKELFYVAEGGEREGGRILKIAPNGSVSRLIEGLPSVGDHHTNGPAIGPDGQIYFGQGVATNSGVLSVRTTRCSAG